MPYIVATLFIFLVSVPSVLFAQTFPDLSKTDSIGGGENDAALIVAIENYAFLPDIDGAEKNGNDWYLHFTRSLGVDPTRVMLLKNEEASKEEIEESVKKLAAMKNASGRLWVVFIGHGAPNPTADGTGVLIGVDAQQNAKSLIARGVAQDSILKPLESASTNNGDAVVILDACFSGKVGNGEPLVPGLQPVVAVPQLNSSVVFLSAARNDEYAGPLPDRSRPAFSYLALGALRGWADADKNGTVSPDELINYTNDSMTVIVKGRKQTANQSGQNASVVLSVGASESGPDWVDFVTSDNGGSTVSLPNASTDAQMRAASRAKFRTGSVNANFRYGVFPLSGLEVTDSFVDVTGGREFGGSVDRDTASTGVIVRFPDTAESLNLIGAQGELILGDRGFTIGLVGAFGTASGEIGVTVLEEADAIFPFPTLQSGVSGTMTSVWSANALVSLGYRLGFGDLTVFPEVGIGAQVTPMTIEFTLDGDENTISLTDISFAAPLTLGVGYDILDKVYLSASGTFFVLPSTQVGLQAGAGFYF